MPVKSLAVDGRDRLPLLLSLSSAAVLTFLVCMTRYADYDLWWHLKLGEWVFTHHALPATDTFSYTVAGRHQYTGEWLADLLIFLTFRAGGFAGLNILKGLLLLATFAFTFLQIVESSGRTRKGWITAVLTIVMVLFAIRFRLFVRPYLFSLPLLSCFLYITDRWRRGRVGKSVYLLPLLMLVWANLSVGAVFGVFVVGVAAALEFFESRSAKLLPVFLLTVAASLANPETWRLYALTLDLTSDPYRTMVGEYQPITREILFGSGLRYTLYFQILAVGGLLYFVFRRDRRDLFLFILFASFLYEAFRQVRLVEVFSVVAAPLFAAALGETLSRVQRIPERIASAGAFCLGPAILLLIPLTVLNSGIYAFGAGPKEGAFPEGALRFLDENGIAGRMFNSYGFGGYIIWRGDGREVFIDGRYRRVYTPQEYGEYAATLESPDAWKAAEEKYRFDYAVLEYDLLSRRFPKHLMDNPGWALVYWDNGSAVYLKRLPKWQRLIDTHEYRVARPAFLDMTYLNRYVQEGRLDEALARLDQEVALDPDNQFVLLARTYLRYQAGTKYLPAIRTDLEHVMEMKPDFAMKHSALAMILSAAGEKERAREEVLRALSLNPLDAAALAQAKSLGIEAKIPKEGIPGHH